MLNREQSEELVKRTKTAINCKYGWLADDKKGGIVGLAWEKVINYSVENTVAYYQARLEAEQAELLTASATEQKELLASINRSLKQIACPDPVPTIEYLKTIVRGIVCDPANGICGNRKQRIVEREERAFNKVQKDLNILDAEESRYSNVFSEVSYNDYNAATGWEPSTPFVMPECLTEDEDKLEEEKALERERKVAITKANPCFAGLLELATEHFNSGGNMAGLGEKLGTSGQTVKNRIQAAVKIANDPFRKPLPKKELRRFSVAEYVIKQQNSGRMSISQMFDIHGSCAPRKRKPFVDPRQLPLF